MLRQNSLKKLTVKSKPTFKLEDGTDFTVQQIRWNSNARKYLFWQCQECGHEWKGHRKLYWEKRKPTKCPQCERHDPYGILIKQVKK